MHNIFFTYISNTFRELAYITRESAGARPRVGRSPWNSDGRMRRRCPNVRGTIVVALSYAQQSYTVRYYCTQRSYAIWSRSPLAAASSRAVVFFSLLFSFCTLLLLFFCALPYEKKWRPPGLMDLAARLYVYARTTQAPRSAHACVRIPALVHCDYNYNNSMDKKKYAGTRPGSRNGVGF